MVTGAAGFVGDALTRGFADRGWHVLAVDRTAGTSLDGVRWLEADLVDGLPHDVECPDLIVHGAWTTADPTELGVDAEGYEALNLQPLLAVLEWATASGAPAFVFLSSSGVFGADDAEGGLTDDTPPSGSSAYARSKRKGEALTSSADVPSVYVVRLGYLFGPGERRSTTRPGVSMVAEWIERARAGETLECRSDDPRREWTFAPDLAEAIERLVSGPVPAHPVHLGSPHVLRDSEVAQLVSRHFPDTEVAVVDPPRPQKAPMIGSSLPALSTMTWTTPARGIAAMLERARVA